MDAIRKIDELQHFRQRIPHGRVYVTKKRPSDGKLHPDEDRLLALASGQRTVLELAQASKLSEFDATKIIFRLLEGGYASVSELKHGEVAAPARGRGAESEPAVRVVATFDEIFGEIAREVASKGLSREFLEAANAALESRTLSESPVLSDLELGADGRFDARKVLDAYARARPHARERAGRLAPAGALRRDVLPALPGRRAAGVARGRGPRAAGQGPPRHPRLSPGALRLTAGTAGHRRQVSGPRPRTSRSRRSPPTSRRARASTSSSGSRRSASTRRRPPAGSPRRSDSARRRRPGPGSRTVSP